MFPAYFDVCVKDIFFHIRAAPTTSHPAVEEEDGDRLVVGDFCVLFEVYSEEAGDDSFCHIRWMSRLGHDILEQIY